MKWAIRPPSASCAGQVRQCPAAIADVLQHGDGNDQVVAPRDFDFRGIADDPMVVGPGRGLLQLIPGDVQAIDLQAEPLFGGRGNGRKLSAAYVEHTHARRQQFRHHSIVEFVIAIRAAESPLGGGRKPQRPSAVGVEKLTERLASHASQHDCSP